MAAASITTDKPTRRSDASGWDANAHNADEQDANDWLNNEFMSPEASITDTADN